jgi:flagellar assembly protein FliH
MGLIKSNLAPPSITPFSLADIEQHAKKVLLRAQRRAEQLLAAAQAEGETIKQEARAEGLAQGHREGLAQGLEQGLQSGQQTALNEHRSQLQQAMTLLTAALASLDASRADLEATGLAEVVRLAIAIATRVTKRQGMIDPAVLTANLTEAMKLVVQSADVRLAVHPQQRATLDAVLPQLRLQWPNLAHVQVVDDATLEPGGCRIFTGEGQIDADLSGQLDRIIAELLPANMSGSRGAGA